MSQEVISTISNFFIAGINYKKTDASIRGQFAINSDQYKEILLLAANYGVSEFFILSTCNRTEIYGFAKSSNELIDLLCTKTSGSALVFKERCFVKQGENAVNHLFEVAAGLESQILGDYEIIGQIKTAIRLSKEHGFVGTFTERLINNVIQSTKVIKNKTVLSGGTVSVSFAAVQYIKNNIVDVANKNILLLGVGKIGRNTCKNLVDYLKTKNITLINRSTEKAAELASELHLRSVPLQMLDVAVNDADVIIVATNAVEPTILTSQLEGKSNKLIIDLSIPYNVEASAQQLPNVTLINVDDLSKLKDKTLSKRQAEVPKAKEIIAEHLAEFLEWCQMRRNAPVFKAVKQKLHDMHQCEMFLSTHKTFTVTTTTAPEIAINKYAIQKVIKKMAVKMRQQHQPGCSYIEAINDFITTHTN